jgi:hypothetical protein
VTPQQREDLPVLLVEVFAAGANREPGASPVPTRGGYSWAVGDRGCFRPVDRLDDFVGPLDHVEGVEADPRLGDLLAGHGRVNAAAVQADGFDRCSPLGAEGGEELLEGGLGPLFADPDDVASVVVGHDGQELAASPVGDLVDADAVEVVQAGVVDVVGDDPADDCVDRLPGAAQ